MASNRILHYATFSGFFGGLLISGSLCLVPCIILLAMIPGGSTGDPAGSALVGALLLLYWGPIVAIVGIPAIIIISIRLVGSSVSKALGAISFYPLVILGYFALDAYHKYREDIAMRKDFTAHTIVNPIGKIDTLILPTNDGCTTDICAQILSDGIANRVAYLHPGRQHGGSGNFIVDTWIVDIQRIGHGAECFNAEKRPGGQIFWLQEVGVYDSCTIEEKGHEVPSLEEVLLHGILLRTGRDSGNTVIRPYGPHGENIVVAYGFTQGKIGDELARWEHGSLRYHKREVGKEFQTMEFLRALTGIKTDRFGEASRLSVEEAVDMVYGALNHVPVDSGAASSYIGRTLREKQRRLQGALQPIDSTRMSKLRDIGHVGCSWQTFYSNSEELCLKEFNKFLGQNFPEQN